MPTVTALKPQKNQKRVNVYLDNKFGFAIDLDNLVLLGIKLNRDFDQEELEEIIKKSFFQKTFDKLLMFATLRPRSEKEVKMWFSRRQVPESIHEDLTKRLYKLELLDDQKFAAWWITQRQTFRPRSKRQLMMELAQKGIAKDIVSNALADSEVDESKIAKKLLDKAKYKWERFDDETKRQKKAQYLSQRGFSWEIIKKAI
jgi:regulatory protein